MHLFFYRPDAVSHVTDSPLHWLIFHSWRRSLVRTYVTTEKCFFMKAQYRVTAGKCLMGSDVTVKKCFMVAKTGRLAPIKTYFHCDTALDSRRKMWLTSAPLVLIHIPLSKHTKYMYQGTLHGFHRTMANVIEHVSVINTNTLQRHVPCMEWPRSNPLFIGDCTYCLFSRKSKGICKNKLKFVRGLYVQIWILRYIF